jgi:hypothetical protein
MALEDLIAQLCQELSLPKEMQRQEKGSYTLIFAKSLQVKISEQDTFLKFHGPLGSLPPQNRENFVVYVAFANLLGTGTGNAIISLDNTGKNLYLSRLLPYPVSFMQFRDELEVFVNYLEIWQKKCQEASLPDAQYRDGILQP